MKNRKKKGVATIVIALSIIVMFVACTQDPIVEVGQYGSIQGRVLYSNGDDHSGIVLTLDKTDGLRAITNSDGSRAIVSLTTSKEDGSFAFYNLEPGTYTIYATSNDSVEKGVATNVVVRDASTVTIEDLLLTATGSITGYVQIDGQSTGNSGFLVSIAGTSYMATTNDLGYYCITGIPAGEGYQLIITKGNYTSNIVSECAVSPKGILRVGVTSISSEDLSSGNNALIWKGSHDDASELSSPQKNWAYFNTSDGCSYIYDGNEWTLLASKGDKGEQGVQGETGIQGEPGASGTNGQPIIWKGSFASSEELENPVYLWAYYNTTDGCSYIYDGVQWTTLASSGAIGETGLSIIWKGSLEQAPENPELYWCYHNTVDGNSYIYDGEAWAILASKGDQGEHGHTLVVDPAVEATCTHTGLTEGMHCIFCDYVYIEQEIVPKLEHTKVVDTPAKAPSLLETGYTEASHCSVCGESISTSVVLNVASPRAGNSRYGFDRFASEPDKQRFYDALYVAAESVIQSTEDYAADDNNLYVISSFDANDFGLGIDEMASVWKVFLMENPRYYFLSQNLQVEGEGVLFLMDKEYATAAKRQMYDASIAQMEDECGALFGEDDLPLTKAVRIHDYIAGKITYAWQADGVTPETPETCIWAHNITGVSYLGRGVCESYAKAFLYLCNLNGVECLIVDGKAKENNEDHAWNYIRIDDEWYLVDVTFDDSGNVADAYYNFGLNAEIMAERYVPNTEENESIDYQYLLPGLSDGRMMLVDVYKNDIFVGVYSSPDSAFESMSGIENEFTIAVYEYPLIEIENSNGLFFYPVEHCSFVSELPNVKTITLKHKKKYSDDSLGYDQYLPIYFLQPLIFENDVKLNSDLLIDGFALYINKLDLNLNKLLFVGWKSEVYGLDDFGCIMGYDGFSSIGSDASDLVDIHVPVSITNVIGSQSCCFINNTLIENQIGCVQFKGMYSFIVEKSYSPLIVTGKADVEIRSICNGVFEHAITAVFPSVDDYPNIKITGSSECNIRFSIHGQMNYLITDGYGNTLSSYVVNASPYLIKGPILTINPEILLSMVTIVSDNAQIDMRCFEIIDNEVKVSSLVINDDGYSCYDGTVLAYYGDEDTPNLPLGQKIIGSHLFDRDYLTSIIIPDGYTTIGYQAFSHCPYLESVILPESISTIESWAFVRCTKLESIIIPDGVDSIKELTFDHCEALKRITIPKTVKSIAWWALSGCYSLEQIVFNGTIEEWNAIEKAEGWNEETSATCVVHCTDGDISI